MGFTRWQDFEEKFYIQRHAARIRQRELTPARLKDQQIALDTALAEDSSCPLFVR